MTPVIDSAVQKIASAVRLLTALGTALVASLALAQTGSLGVSVFDTQGDPVAGATVGLSHPQSFVATTAVYTNTKGHVFIPILRAGPGYAIRVTVPGCAALLREAVTVIQDETTLLAVLLTGSDCPKGVLRAELPTDIPQAPDELIVVIGRRVKIDELAGSFRDQKFEAVYDVLDVVFGKWPDPQIRFAAYDHYGLPEFAKYETVMLYVLRYGKQLIHEKYQFHDVYRTADGRWAGCGDPYRRESEVYRGHLRPSALPFEPTRLTAAHESDIETLYPSDLFDVDWPIVTCKRGVFIQDLLKIKLGGILRRRHSPFDLSILRSN